MNPNSNSKRADALQFGAAVAVTVALLLVVYLALNYILDAFVWLGYGVGVGLSITACLIILAGFMAARQKIARRNNAFKHLFTFLILPPVVVAQLYFGVQYAAANPLFDSLIDDGIATFLPRRDEIVYTDVNGKVLYRPPEQPASAVEVRDSLLAKAIVVIEDERFFTRNQAIDWIAVGRAIKRNAEGEREGGSTIEIQTIKWLLDWKKVELKRKPEQFLLAVRLRQRLSDPYDRLTLYINVVAFDKRGLKSVAYDWFRITNLRDLAPEQAALIAAALKNPTLWNPRTHAKAAKERRDIVLEKMFKQGYLTELQYKKALSTPIALKSRLSSEKLPLISAVEDSTK
jgi:membrane peptidoglycan carboxypeptidase